MIKEREWAGLEVCEQHAEPVGQRRMVGGQEAERVWLSAGEDVCASV